MTKDSEMGSRDKEVSAPRPRVYRLAEQTLREFQARTRRRAPSHRETPHPLTYNDEPTGLACRVELREFPDFDALEWCVWLRNGGAADAEPVDALYSLDLCRALDPKTPVTLHHTRGSLAAADDFEPRADTLEAGQLLRLFTRSDERGGNSSEDSLPFFELQWGGQGLMIGLGWTGPWVAEFARDAAGALTLRAGIETSGLRLRPGEEIRAPRVLLLEWRGDRDQARNRWRRLILEQFSPRPGGRPFDGMITYGNWGSWMDCARHIGEVEFLRRHELPVECYWVDAGWTDMSQGWVAHQSQQTPCPRLFPRGIRPLADAARRHEMKFLLWMVPESAHPAVGIGKAHPEWLGEPVKAPDGDFYGLDHGEPAVNAHMIEHFSHVVAEHGVDVFRQDGTSLFPAESDPGRASLRRNRFIQGFYEFWDALLARHPHLLIDNCACGGRKLDLETLRRSIPLWRSDAQAGQFDPVTNQGYTYGLAPWAPLFGAVVMLDRLTPYSFRSAYAPALMLSWPLLPDWKRPPEPPVDPLERWVKVDLDLLRRLLREYLSVRPYLFGDFYPLTPYSIAADSWLAWQFDRPDLGAGMVQAFRRPQSPFVSGQFRLRGLEPAADYEITDLDQPGAVTTMSGRELMETGLTITMRDKPQAMVLTYRNRMKTLDPASFSHGVTKSQQQESMK
jgi:alpha-galactosidase